MKNKKVPEFLYGCPDLCKNIDQKCMECVEGSNFETTPEVQKIIDNNSFGYARRININ